MVKPLISIIIPNRNGNITQLKHTITSLKNQNGIRSEIFLVDNGSSKEYFSTVRKTFPSVTHMRFRTNQGYSKAINTAAAKAHGKFIFSSNNDIFLEQNFLKILTDYLYHHQDTAVVGGVSFLDQEFKKLDSGRQRYNLTTGLFSITQPQNSTESDWISGSGLLVSKKTFEQLGGFDKTFFFYYEDVDFCLRNRVLGRKIYTIPNAKMIHHRGSTAHTRNYHFFRYYQLHKARQQLLIKHGTLFQIVIGLLLQLVVFSVYHAMILRDHSLGPLLAATKDTLSNLPALLQTRTKYQQWRKHHSTSESSARF
jgi:GT2 family glycosyltransferase